MSCSIVPKSRLLLLSKHVRCFSTFKMVIPPSRLVQGLTLERIENDPEVEAYIRANFPGALDGENAFDKLTKVEGRSYKQERKESRILSYPRNIRPLLTYTREEGREEGTNNSLRLRSKAMIPGILYGSDPTIGIYSFQRESKLLVKTPWSEIQRELNLYYHHFSTRVYHLTVYEDEEDTEGTVHTVIPRHVQRHPVKESIYCANFLRYHAGRPIKLPVKHINQDQSPALKREGFVLPLQRYVECIVEESADIPEAMEVDCSGLKYTQLIRQDRVILPDGVRLSDRVVKRGKEFVIGVVYGKGRGAT